MISSLEDDGFLIYEAGNADEAVRRPYRAVDRYDDGRRPPTPAARESGSEPPRPLPYFEVEEWDER
jgi:hypothetical protein